MKKTLTAVSLGLLTSISSFQAMATQADDISVSEPYAREIPPGAPASASFMTLDNMSDQTIKLVLADSDAAKIVELHAHTNDNGVMRMRKVEFIEIPANGQTVLKPGGLHIMLINPVTLLSVGETVSVKLQFEDGSSKHVQMPVKSFKNRMGNMNNEMNHNMDHDMSGHSH